MKAFISYSHKDSTLLDSLHSHLATLRRQNLIITWTDREIPAGGVIDDHVDHNIEDAQLHLFLISSDFIDSNYCYDREFKKALKLHEEKKTIIVPIILRACDWKIPELRQFKALPKDAKPVTSWTSTDEAFADIANGLRAMLERGFSEPAKTAKPAKASKASKFVPDARHVSEDQRKVLKALGDEVVERLTAHLAKLSDEDRKIKVGKYHGIFWSNFAAEFDLDDGLKSLLVERFEEAKAWIQQQRAINDDRLVRADPQKYRNTMLKAIWGNAKGLGWDEDKVHAFAAEKLDRPVASLTELGNSQLKLLRSRIRYEVTRKGLKSGSKKSTRKAGAKGPKLPAAKEILELILKHENADERGLLEDFNSPTGPLDVHFVFNTRGRGAGYSLKKKDFRPAVEELLKLGWLLPPETDGKANVYELNPKAAQP